MTVTPPTIEGIRASIPGIRDISPINAGGFKSVFNADINGVHEALKLIEIPAFPDRSEEEQALIQKELRGRIFREIGILERISIPELVKLGSINKMETSIDGKEYVVYSEELIEGSDLMQIVKAGTALPSENDLRDLFVVLLKAIKALWAEGFIHRDIKPANIMKSEDSSRPYILMDLGIAFSIQDTALTFNAADRLPPATYKYIAPEMLFPDFREKIDYRSDLYTAAMTVYEYAAFKHPLSKGPEDLSTTLTRALNQSPEKLSKYRNDLSAELCGIVDQMLKKKPALRPSNLDGLIHRMEAHV